MLRRILGWLLYISLRKAAAFLEPMLLGILLNWIATLISIRCIVQLLSWIIIRNLIYIFVFNFGFTKALKKSVWESLIGSEKDLMILI